VSRDIEQMAVLPHLSSEFMLWIWWVSECNGCLYNFASADDDETVSLDDDLESVEMWLDDRITMRPSDDTKVSNVMTGESVGTAPEAKVAIANEKVIQEIRMGLRIDDREYNIGLKGSELSLHGVRLPAACSVGEGLDEAVFERFHLLEEVDQVLAKLFNDFARVRVSDEWQTTIAPAIGEWLNEDLDDDE